MLGIHTKFNVVIALADISTYSEVRLRLGDVRVVALEIEAVCSREIELLLPFAVGMKMRLAILVFLSTDDVLKDRTKGLKVIGKRLLVKVALSVGQEDLRAIKTE